MNEGNNLFIFPSEYIRVVGGDLGIYFSFHSFMLLLYVKSWDTLFV